MSEDEIDDGATRDRASSASSGDEVDRRRAVAAASLARRITGGVRARILASYVILLAIAVRLGARRAPGAPRTPRRSSRGGPCSRRWRNFCGSPAASARDGPSRSATTSTRSSDLPRPQRARRRRGADHGPPPRASAARPRRQHGGLQLRRFRRAVADLDEVERGEIDTPAAGATWRSRWRASGTLGTFAVASFTADEREEVDEAVRIIAAVAGASCCWARCSPSRSPAACWRRSASCATRPVGVRDPDGPPDPGRGRRRDRRARGAFNGCSIGSRWRSRASASSSATSATSCGRRSRSRAGHLELLAEGHVTDEAARREAMPRHRRARPDEPVRRRPAAPGQGREPRLPSAGDGAARRPHR